VHLGGFWFKVKADSGTRQEDEVTPMKVLIADDQPRVRTAMRVLLDMAPHVHVIGEALNADELLAVIEASQPDLVLLDWELPGMLADAALAGIRRLHPGLLVIALSARPEAHVAALAAGTDAFVSKLEAPDRLLRIIQQNTPVPTASQC
jgi:DNA-binding NarL/FixJ family response regulator